MRAVVTGGTGHLGSYLVPCLVKAGYEVICISRGERGAYTQEDPTWAEVEFRSADRRAMEAEGKFGEFVASLRPDLICDLISYTPAQAEQIVAPFLERPTRFIQIGTIWVYEYKITVPVTEEHPRTERRPNSYGHNKTLIENYLLGLTRENKLAATVINPGHISAREWLPINPQGNLDIKVWTKLLSGQKLLLPNDGQATLHHVHSDDLARLILCCLEQPENSVGETFNAVCSEAITLRGYAEGVAAHFGQKAVLEFAAWPEFEKQLHTDDANASYDHVRRSPCCSMEKARRKLGFEPRETSLSIATAAVEWHRERGLL